MDSLGASNLDNLVESLSRIVKKKKKRSLAMAPRKSASPLRKIFSYREIIPTRIYNNSLGKLDIRNIG